MVEPGTSASPARTRCTRCTRCSWPVSGCAGLRPCGTWTGTGRTSPGTAAPRSRSRRSSSAASWKTSRSRFSTGHRLSTGVETALREMRHRGGAGSIRSAPSFHVGRCRACLSPTLPRIPPHAFPTSPIPSPRRIRLDRTRHRASLCRTFLRSAPADAVEEGSARHCAACAGTLPRGWVCWRCWPPCSRLTAPPRDTSGPRHAELRRPRPPRLQGPLSNWCGRPYGSPTRRRPPFCALARAWTCSPVPGWWRHV